MIASGKTLPELGLTQDSINEPTSYAMQCRVTTENPAHDFRPDTGTIDVFRMPCGFGIRLDDGPGFPGAKITPHYDSLLVSPCFMYLVMSSSTDTPSVKRSYSS